MNQYMSKSYWFDYFIIPFFLVQQSKYEDKGYNMYGDLVLSVWKRQKLFLASDFFLYLS